MSERQCGKSLGLAVAFSLAGSVWAAGSDLLVAVNAKIALLTADEVSVKAVQVTATKGSIILQGKVKSDRDKEQAAAAVLGVEGVKNVKNLLQVVPEAFREGLKVADGALKESIEGSFRADPALSGIQVASVTNGVVLLSGQGNLGEKLRALEVAWGATGVQRVSSEITVDR